MAKAPAVYQTFVHSYMKLTGRGYTSTRSNAQFKELYQEYKAELKTIETLEKEHVLAKYGGAPETARAIENELKEIRKPTGNLSRILKRLGVKDRDDTIYPVGETP